MDSLKTLLDLLRTTVVFLGMTTVLVLFHELGHFWVAKLFGMKVEAFAVMFGGIRKTDLESEHPEMLPKGWVATGYIASLCIGLLGAVLPNQAVLIAGFVLAGIVFPVWISLRIAKLYRLEAWPGLKSLVIFYNIAIVILLVSRTGSVPSVIQVLGALFFASIIGVLVLYYVPLLGNGDESESLGMGSIAGRPVRFRPVWYCTGKDGVEYSLLALPLGGFCRVAGMAPRENGSETLIEGGFYSKGPFPRFMMLLAGPVFSLLLGVIIAFVAFASFGEPKVLKDPVIGFIAQDGAAGKAGLKVGDRFISADGQPINNFFDIVKFTRERGETPFNLVYQREGKQFEIALTAEVVKEPTPVLNENLEPTGDTAVQAKLGIGPPIGAVPMTLPMAFVKAISLPVEGGKMFASLFTNFSKAKENVGGPAAIAQATHQASNNGLYDVLLLSAGLSMSFGFMNLLPIPPLDGGQMAVAVIEMFRKGKRLSLDVQVVIAKIGLALVMGLVLFVLTQDIGRGMGR